MLRRWPSVTVVAWLAAVAALLFPAVLLAPA
jgi:hypothetical protein